MTTANDLLLTAALKLGAKEPGGSLTANESTEGLKILISMLDSWGVDPQYVYQIAQSSYSWTPGSASQTIGTSGIFNGLRPNKILSAYFRDVNNLDFHLDVLGNRQTYDDIKTKTLSTNFPGAIFYDPGFPLGTIYIHPVPNIAITLYINYTAPLQRFTLGTDTLSMPPGYQWAIEHNLAIALESVFSLQAPASVSEEAIKSKNRLFRLNNKPIYSKTETASILNTQRGTRGNIYEGF